MNHEGNESFMNHEGNHLNHMNHEGNESFMNQGDHNESFVGDVPPPPPSPPPSHNLPNHNTEEELQFNESFVGNQEHQESENINGASVCGGPNNQFTTKAQLSDASNNLVNKNQINSVATFCPEFNAQGSNPPQGFGSWESTAHAVF